MKPDSLPAAGSGATKPITGNAAKEGKAKNRRVKIAPR
jgi:outer membrane protein OmpA-like peptidoglycan-associated protein